MKQLVYGIVRECRRAICAVAWRLGGGVLEVVDEGELAAVFSVVPDVCSTPRIADLLIYAGVIDQLHVQCAILPMPTAAYSKTRQRFVTCCVASTPTFWQPWTGSVAATNSACGCYWSRDHPADRDNAAQPRAAAVTSFAGGQGAAYLTAQRAIRQQDAERQQACEVVERVRSFFQGTFTSCECEVVAQPGVMQSLSFLVPRDARTRFHESFGRLQTHGREKVLLTGPWPPYHFAPVQLNRAR